MTPEDAGQDTGPHRPELHLLDAGHFAAEEKTAQIAGLILEFLGKHGIE